jgi:hypothetical protein
VSAVFAGRILPDGWKYFGKKGLQFVVNSGFPAFSEEIRLFGLIFFILRLFVHRGQYSFQRRSYR